MVDIRRQVVDTDSINTFTILATNTVRKEALRLTNSLEQSSISQANLAVAERVLSSLGLVTGLAAGLVRSSDDLEALAGNRVDEIGPFDDERGDCSRNLGAERQKRNLGLVIEMSAHNHGILMAHLSKSRPSKTCLSLPRSHGLTVAGGSEGSLTARFMVSFLCSKVPLSIQN